MKTDYNQIGNLFVQAKNNPIKYYSERWTLLKAIGDVRGKSVLDLACGDGDYARTLKQLGASWVVGVDISERMIGLAREQESRSPLGIEYHVRDVAQLEPLGSFDLVVAVFLLVYAPTEQALTAMCRAVHANLVAGGRFISATSGTEIAEPHIAASKDFGISMRLHNPDQDGSELNITLPTPNGPIMLTNYRWSKATYERVLTNVGFRNIRWHPMEVSPEGIEALGAERWHGFVTYPTISIFECEA